MYKNETICGLNFDQVVLVRWLRRKSAGYTSPMAYLSLIPGTLGGGETSS